MLDACSIGCTSRVNHHQSTSPSPSIIIFTVMATDSEDVILSITSSFDQIYADFKSTIEDIQSLKSKYNAEVKKSDAIQFRMKSLQSENERLRKSYAESLNRLTDQIESRTSCQMLKDELKKINDEHSQKENEFKIVIGSLKHENAMRIQVMESQIRELQAEKAANEAVCQHLRQDLTVHKNHITALTRRLEQVSSDVESKYQYEIQGLRDCLLVEQEEKTELKKKVQELEKELLVSSMELVESRQDSTSNRNVDSLKQKIMKLRKENEGLKRQIIDKREG
ncbi:unnamed protein product [Cuscuta epithymum]|uniref:Uncharacterized protein n=1 Tax=Cuscuta epithymum TaxID=186058 RepID=A0AAV0FG61_9ASTE|nr:unnamed protein product [Cuscuta epithymum]